MRRAFASPKAMCSGTGRRPKHCTEEQYFKTQGEMAELFADMPVALGKHCRIGAALQSHTGTGR